MVRIYTQLTLRFKDVKELGKLSHMLESLLARCIYCYHIRQVKIWHRILGQYFYIRPIFRILSVKQLFVE